MCARTCRRPQRRCRGDHVQPCATMPRDAQRVGRKRRDPVTDLVADDAVACSGDLVENARLPQQMKRVDHHADMNGREMLGEVERLVECGHDAPVGRGLAPHPIAGSPALTHPPRRAQVPRRGGALVNESRSINGRFPAPVANWSSELRPGPDPAATVHHWPARRVVITACSRRRSLPCPFASSDGVQRDDASSPYESDHSCRGRNGQLPLTVCRVGCVSGATATRRLVWWCRRDQRHCSRTGLRPVFALRCPDTRRCID